MLIFKVSKGDKSIILFGTTHLCHWKFIPNFIKELINDCKIFIEEHANLSEESKKKLNFFKEDKLTEKIFINNLSNDSKELLFGALKNYFDKEHLEIDVESLNNKGTLYYANCAAYREGIENVIRKNFISRGNKIFFLESEEIVETYIQNTNFSLIFEALTALYASEKITQIDSINVESLKNIAPLLWSYLNNKLFKSTLDNISKQENDWIFKERNLQWLSVIEDYIDKCSDAIICVGEGHLIGSNGLIKLLSERGFSFEKYNDNGELDKFTLDDLEKIEEESIVNEVKYNNFNQDKFDQLNSEQKLFLEQWAQNNNDIELLNILIDHNQLLEQAEHIGQILKMETDF